MKFTKFIALLFFMFVVSAAGASNEEEEAKETPEEKVKRVKETAKTRFEGADERVRCMLYCLSVGCWVALRPVSQMNLRGSVTDNSIILILHRPSLQCSAITLLQETIENIRAQDKKRIDRLTELLHEKKTLLKYHFEGKEELPEDVRYYIGVSPSSIHLLLRRGLMDFFRMHCFLCQDIEFYTRQVKAFQKKLDHHESMTHDVRLQMFAFRLSVSSHMKQEMHPANNKLLSSVFQPF